MDIFGWDLPVWFLVILALLFAYYIYSTWTFGALKQIGVKGPRPIPVLGHMYQFFTKGHAKYEPELIRTYGKITGYFMGRDPMLIVADVDMLKEILVKRFDCFTNRRIVEIGEYPTNLMLTTLTDDHWKHVRALMSPTFSSGKLRRMNDLINNCGKVLVKNLNDKAEKDEAVEMKQTAGYYTMDVIGSTAFGILVDSQSDPDNQFIKMANKTLEVRLSLAVIVFLLAPPLFKYCGRFGITMMKSDVREFFVGIMKKAMEARDSQTDERQDFLQLMLNARSDDITNDIGGVGGDISHLAVDATGVWSKKALTEGEILAQSMLFFLAGYDTTAGAISFLCYNLATNQHCQDTLIEEIDTVMHGHEEPTYDLVKKMPYLDMCLNESLRIYPPAPVTQRSCKNDITIRGQFIPKGMVVDIPIYWLHHDPDVWPEPDLFKPERFSPDEKAARDPYNFMPFGYGPRSCIAMRLALLECKICMVHILQNFRVVTCSETQIPLELEKMKMRAVKGIQLKLQKRQQ